MTQTHVKYARNRWAQLQTVKTRLNELAQQKGAKGRIAQKASARVGDEMKMIKEYIDKYLQQAADEEVKFWLKQVEEEEVFVAKVNGKKK